MSPKYLRIGGTIGIATGPAAPIITDQKIAGRSRAAQRQYLNGADQKAGDDMAEGEPAESTASFLEKPRFGFTRRILEATRSSNQKLLMSVDWPAPIAISDKTCSAQASK